jgi:Ca2+-binding EF-hand superfamily protein
MRKFQSQSEFDSRRVWSLAHKYRLPLEEVQRIAEAFSGMQKDLFGHVQKEELRSCLCKVFDVATVDTRIIEDAILACSPEREMTLDSFVSWYVQNMFNHVAELTGAEDKCSSDTLVRNLAKECHTTVCGIDRIKYEFDRVDNDGNGTLDREEFECMLHSLFHAKEGDLSKSRLSHFWMEIDADGNGYIDFEEFCRWHTKYFNSDELSCNLVNSFYDSFMPDVQRRKCLLDAADAQ